MGKRLTHDHPEKVSIREKRDPNQKTYEADEVAAKENLEEDGDVVQPVLLTVRLEHGVGLQVMAQPVAPGRVRTVVDRAVIPAAVDAASRYLGSVRRDGCWSGDGTVGRRRAAGRKWCVQRQGRFLGVERRW